MKLILSLLLAIVVTPSLHAQSLKDLFLKMPQEVCPALSEYNRLELVDNQRNGKPMQTRNLFNSYSKMETLTDSHARLIVSQNSEKEMLMLPQSDGTKIIMVVNTVFCDSIPDASICFYSTNWKPLTTTDYIDAPIATDFRKISVSPLETQLTIKTHHPLSLNVDGVPQNSSTTTDEHTTNYQWDADQNRFTRH